MSTPTCLECRLDHLDIRGRPGPQGHAGDVKADVGEAARRGLLAEPPRGQAAEPTLLHRRHRLGRDPEAGARPGLHLAEDDAALPGDDQVELTLPAAPVPAEDGVAPARVPGGGKVLAPGAQVEPPPVDRRPAGAGRRHQISLPASSSTLTTLNVTTWTSETNRAGRYMSHTHASWRWTSK